MCNLKIGCISDLHFKLYRGNNNFVPFIVKAVDHFIELCKEREVDVVVLGGDIFHAKSYVQTFALDKALISIRKLTEQFECFFVVGNHDMYSNQENEKINLLKVFESDGHVANDYEFYDRNGVRLHFLPYQTDDNARAKIASASLLKNGKNLLFTHLGLRGFSLNDYHEDVYSELTENDICKENFDLIVSGHYHHFQQKGNIVYISSPIESHFGDEGKHGFVFIDTEKLLDVEYIENEYTPKFKTYELNKTNFPEIITTKDCFLRVKINKQIDYNILTKLKKKLESQNYFVIFDYNITGNIQKISVVDGWDSYIYEDTDKIIQNYIDALETDFDKKELREFIFN